MHYGVCRRVSGIGYRVSGMGYRVSGMGYGVEFKDSKASVEFSIIRIKWGARQIQATGPLDIVISEFKIGLGLQNGIGCRVVFSRQFSVFSSQSAINRKFLILN